MIWREHFQVYILLDLFGNDVFSLKIKWFMFNSIYYNQWEQQLIQKNINFIYIYSVAIYNIVFVCMYVLN